MIQANGGPGLEQCDSFDHASGSGSGGTIKIFANDFSGSGTVRANGGSNTTAFTCSAPGGGGAAVQ